MKVLNLPNMLHNHKDTHHPGIRFVIIYNRYDYAPLRRCSAHEHLWRLYARIKSQKTPSAHSRPSCRQVLLVTSFILSHVRVIADMGQYHNHQQGHNRHNRVGAALSHRCTTSRLSLAIFGKIAVTLLADTYAIYSSI